MKLDILAMAAHPDDAEMSAGGTMAMQISQGKKVGIVDFTRGELGTRGTPEIRAEESKNAGRIIGIHARENLGFRDGFYKNDEEHQLELIKIIRKYQPTIVLANAIDDRHPDHGKGAKLAIDACFLSGLRMIKTQDEFGNNQEEWRPKFLYHYIQDRYIKPDFIVDISNFWSIKDASIRAYKSQFYDPDSSEPDSYLTSPVFMEFLDARSREMGHAVGGTHGEGFTSHRAIGVKDIFDLN